MFLCFFFLSGWSPVTRSDAGAGSAPLCTVDPWWIFCRVRVDQGRLNNFACRIACSADRGMRRGHRPLAGRGGKERMRNRQLSSSSVVRAPAPSAVLSAVGGVLQQLFFEECLRACKLAFAGGCGLTVGLNRGVAPADVASADFKPRRPRRVADAAISTRCEPPQVWSGDTAATLVVFVFFSGGATAATADRVVAESMRQGWFQGPGCSFVCCRGLSVNCRTAGLFLDVTCNVVFPD